MYEKQAKALLAAININTISNINAALINYYQGNLGYTTANSIIGELLLTKKELYKQLKQIADEEEIEWKLGQKDSEEASTDDQNE